MTRTYVYGAAFVTFVAATAMTLTSILTTHWVSYSVTADNSGATFSKNIGLHHSCSSLQDPACRPFPEDEDCRGDERYFCSMWRTSGFLMSFATIVELATIVSFLVIMAGGKQKREQGWMVVGTFLIADAAVEFAGMGIVAHLFDTDEQFMVPGWSLDWSWILCTLSASISVLLAAGLAISAWALPPEEGYEYLEDPPQDEGERSRIGAWLNTSGV